MKSRSKMNAGDLIWIMLNSEIDEKDIGGVFSNLITDDCTCEVEVQIQGKAHGEFLDVAFYLEEQNTFYMDRIKSLLLQCKQSPWGNENKVRFSIFIKSEELT